MTSLLSGDFGVRLSDLLLTGIGRLVTNQGRPGSGHVINNAAVAVSSRSLGSAVPTGTAEPNPARGGVVVWAGPEADLPDEFRDTATIDCEGRAAIPGLVDSHTHLAFAGDRGDEFVQRLAGADYEEILAAGGGIQSTVRSTRASSLPDLVNSTVARLERMKAYGTTTVEVKSGYGLDVETEVRQLEAASSGRRDCRH